MCFVLSMVFSGSALGWTPIENFNYNLSFEYDSEGEQMWCHADGNLVYVLAWNDNEVNTARTEIDCPNSLGIEGCLCKDDWSTDGMIKLTMGQWVNPTDQNVIAWQTLDPAYDANVIIKADHEYRVTFDSFKWMMPPLTFYFYYGNIGDNDSIDADVNTIAEFEVILEAGEYQTVTYSFRAEAEQPYLGEPLGLRFLEVGQGFYWIDNVRIEYRNLALAREPSPERDAKYVSQNVGLNWAAGTYVADVNGHDVYFGTSRSDVNDADRFDVTGIYREAQDTNSYTIPEPEIPLELGQSYYWRVDEVNEDYVPGPIPVPPDHRWKGPVWKFRVEGPAANPSPEDAAEDESIYLILKWEPGTGSDEHDVYFGTDFDEVSEADDSDPNVFQGKQVYGANSYNPGVLELSRTYYWRIDERNDTEGRLINGYVWSFTTAMYHVIDDMESYESGVNEIRDTWIDAYINDSRAEVSLITTEGEGDANYVHSGENSMRYYYTNFADPYVALAELPFDTAQDWTAAGFKALMLYLRGDFLNEAGAVQPIYIQISDGTNTGAVQYEDSNDLIRGWVGWQEWNIDLQDFVKDAPFLNLSAITKLGIKIGDGTTVADAGYDVYFDDIRLYPMRCVVEEAAGSFTDDCGVDIYDLAVLASDWLLSGIGNVTASAPSGTGLFGHWTMNDNANTSEVLDSSVNGNHGVFYDDATGAGSPIKGDTSDHSVAGVNDLALEFDGEDDYVEIPALDVSSNTITIAAWVKRTTQGHPYDGIVMSSNAYDPDGEAPDPNYTAGLQFGANMETWQASYELSFMWTGYSWEWCPGLFVPPEEWAFVALTVAPDVATIYLHDGITMQAARKYDTYEPLPWDAVIHVADQMQFGPESNRFFPGAVDDVRIYNRTLAPAEILYLAQAGDAEFPLESWRANANPDDDDVVDLKDFAIMADNWLTEVLWP